MNELNLKMQETELNERLKWFISLRWFAVAGVFIVILLAGFAFNIRLNLFYLFAGNVILLVYNIALLVYYNRLKEQKYGKEWFLKANRFANFQISADLIILAYLIHFTGGAENPFIFYFIFHMIIASILLTNRAAYLQATLAVCLLGTICAIGYFNNQAHYHLTGFIQQELSIDSRYLAGILFVFITTLYLAVYMATSIVNRLRVREKELAVANEKLEEQDRLKSRYVLTVSHDLQSSLSTIQSCLKVVLSDLTGSISEKSKEMIARAEQRSIYLLHFVKNLLDLSRMRAEKEIVKNTVSLVEVTRKAVEQMKLKTDDKKITVNVESPANGALIHANPDAMDQLMANLLGNAIKYTPWGGKVGISIKEQPGFFKIVVWDTGIGISQENLPHIFEDFYRAKNAEQMEKDGTGLGLSIVKKIIDTHKGDIWVESIVGKESKFIFTLPRGESI